MSKKSSLLGRGGALGRSFAVSMAGIRAGGAFALDNALSRLRGTEQPFESALAKREAKRFVGELGRLKGSYVKIGQMMAMLGEHFLPPALTEALHELESGTAPLPWEAVAPVLEENLGDRLAELDVEREAMAAASLAQVHRATVRASGEQICLKVQYPGLADVIDADFDAVVRMLLMARWLKAGRELDDWLGSMREQLHHEIDYPRERAMAERLRAELQAEADHFSARGIHYHIPMFHDRYCGPQVLAMEFIEGHAVGSPEVQSLSLERRSALGRAMLELFFCELYRWGTLQTDPNFGNYLIRTRAGRDELVLLDFGSTLECDDSFLRNFGLAIAAGQVQDRPALVEALTGLGCLREDSSDFARQSFSDFCLQLLEPLRPAAALPREYVDRRGRYRWGDSRLMQRVGRQAAGSAATRHFTRPSREFAMIARKLTGVFTFIAVLGARFNGHDIVHDYIDPWLERHAP